LQGAGLRGALRDSLFVLTPFLAGMAAARAGLRPPPGLFEAALSLLVALAGFEIGLGVNRAPAASARAAFAGLLLAPVTLVSGAAAAAALSPLLYVPPCVSAAIGAASGWYSLAVPVVAAHAPPYATLALLANMAREQLHLVLYPLLARRGLRLEAIALGGATTMDAGLPVVMAAGGPEAAVAAMSHGAALTLALPLVLPQLLRLCG
jgi:uncharacterized membrane protein YbjE (DUF340 family)